MTKRIFRSTLLVAAVVLLCSLGMILGVLLNYFNATHSAQLRDELRIAAVGTELEGAAFLSALDAKDYRLTWVAPDGTVLFDTSTDSDAMENHSDREEIRDALETGSGSALRQSATLLEQTSYEAVRLSDGSVLRISMSRQTMLILLIGMLHPLLVVTSLAIILSMVLAHRMSRKIVEPLNTLDLEHPLENDVYEEISPLLQRINQQHLQISHQMRKLRRKSDEFIQITANMREGLVVLDKETNIRSINPAAQRIFGVDERCLGSSFLLIDQGNRARHALNDALDKGHGSARVELDGREYQLDMSSIRSEGRLLGAVVLAVDVTEVLHAQQARREFSANVSHELKTPLQSIIGSAELLESGLVKPEDTPRFIGHIRTEAARLVNLIEDIIRLSQLDEGAAIPTEEVDLLPLAREVTGMLQNTAQARDVTLNLNGTGCRVSGSRRLLSEIIYNLCDNAIKYNVPGGRVEITVEPGILTVSDTGIGIPPEHQDRVFERFYRVDKSHSKQSGGTGLGLSIVKHAVQFHSAQLELNSTPGKGTTITVRF